ncbi:hypothetical protein FACS189451_05860 [Bacteroidia bacterium]|nr:hypothetical protein FACS189451_05860 [Bacteroidia bacterium]
MKKTLNIIVSLFILALAFFACEDKPSTYEFPKEEYYYDIPDVPVTEDYVVGVSYDIRGRDTTHNAWWDGTKNIHQAYTGTPSLGEYDMRLDPQTLQQHLEWGKQAGVDFFILSWGGRGYNDTILQDWERLYSQNQGYPKVVIRFDPGYRFPKKANDSLMRNPLAMDSLRMDFDSVYTHVMMHDFAYKNKNTGFPVMILTNITNQVHIPSLNGFTDFLRKTGSVNNKIWIMAELQGQWTSPERWGYNARNGYPDAVSDGWVQPDTIKAFDAFFITDISTSNYDRYYGFYSFLDYNYKYWQSKLKNVNKEYVPTIMPAFDNLVNDPVSNTYLIPRWKDAGGAYAISGSQADAPAYDWSGIKENPYKTLANVAKRNVGPSRIVIIYSWNNFTNGTTLEPTQEYNDDYLKYTKQFFKK